MKIGRRVLSLLFALLFTLSVAGCGNWERVHKIGILMPSKNEPRWTQDSDSLLRQLQAKGYQVEIKNAEDDVQRQIEQIEAMIYADWDVLVIAAHDGSQLTQVLQKAADKRMKVIAYDRLIMDTANVDYYVTFDNFEVGRLQGAYLEEALDLEFSSGPFNIEIFSGALTDNNSMFFYEGAMSVLMPYIVSGKLVVKSGQIGMSETSIHAWQRGAAKDRMTELLRDYYKDGTELHAVLSPNDGLAMGVIDALREFGLGSHGIPFPLLTGQDSDLENIKAIINGEQSMTVFKDTRTLADRIIRMIDDILLNDAPETNDSRTYHNNVKMVPTFICKPVLVTKDNFKQVLIDSGYYELSDILDDHSYM